MPATKQLLWGITSDEWIQLVELVYIAKNMTHTSIFCLFQIKRRIILMKIMCNIFENGWTIRNYFLQCLWKKWFMNTENSSSPVWIRNIGYHRPNTILFTPVSGITSHINTWIQLLINSLVCDKMGTPWSWSTFHFIKVCPFDEMSCLYVESIAWYRVEAVPVSRFFCFLPNYIPRPFIRAAPYISLDHRWGIKHISHAHDHDIIREVLSNVKHESACVIKDQRVWRHQNVTLWHGSW